MKRTPLCDEHIHLGAKMAEFAGWEMPLWYGSGQSAEHHATRKACGLFDICHMGEFEIQGHDALAFMSKMLTNHVGRLEDGQAMYNFMLNPMGGVIDDCILYRFNETHFMLVVNASNQDKDFTWLKEHASGEVSLNDISGKIAKIDMQGPKAPLLMSHWIPGDTLKGLKFFRFLPDVKIDDIDVLISRTGYTGEIGFELYTDIENVVNLWQLLLKHGETLGVLPCGLGARDTLRVEAGLPLHGHELTADRIALGHPWMFAIDLESQFIGCDALKARLDQEEYNHVLPFAIEGPRKAMSEWAVLHQDRRIGSVLSGVISPSLENQPIGFLLSDIALESGSGVQFQHPSGSVVLQGRIAETPFVALTSRKKMARFL